MKKRGSGVETEPAAGTFRDKGGKPSFLQKRA